MSRWEGVQLVTADELPTQLPVSLQPWIQQA